jgi:hypothetical protein
MIHYTCNLDTNNTINTFLPISNDVSYNTPNIFVDTQGILVLEPVGAVQHYCPYVYPAVWVDRESFISYIGQT